VTDSPADAPARDPFAPPAVLLMGSPGGGKTDSLATILAQDLDLFIVGTEPRFIESLLDSCKRRAIPTARLHWITIEPVKPSFSSMMQQATNINNMSYESLSQIKLAGDKKEYNQFITLLQSLSNFRCEHCGREFGAVDKWGPDKCLVVDSLSGINIMAYKLMMGSKPTAAPGEWGVAMNLEEDLINKLCADTRCMFVLTAHIDRETNEITGGSNIFVGALGKKLAPKIPRFFSEVVRAYKEGDKYWWSTASVGYELKKRTLPDSEKIAPDFKPIIDAWRARLVQTKGATQ
jgi:hypothetical protein